jgi:hypothetical protein
MRKPGQHLAELYRRWGRRVFERDGILFTNVDPGSRIFTPGVDHGDYELTPEQAAGVLREGGGLVLRYPSTTQAGLPGGAYVCTETTYGMSSLTKRMRNYVRRGQQACEIRPMNLDDLVVHGLRLNQETDGRHGRARPAFCQARRWERTAAEVFTSPGAVAMGAWVAGELASYQVGVLDGEWVYAVIQMSRTDLLEHHPNHTLDFAFNQWAFAQPGVRGVSIGPLALRANEGLHNYKIRMGFAVEKRNVALRLHPVVRAAAAHRWAEWAVARARKWAPLHRRLEGVEIVIRGSRITAGDSVLAAVQESKSFQESTVEFSALTEPEKETT